MKNKIMITVAGIALAAIIVSFFCFANQYRAGGEGSDTIFTFGSTQLTINLSENKTVLTGEERKAVLDVVGDCMSSGNCIEENIEDNATDNPAEEYDLILDCNNGYLIYISTADHLITYVYNDDNEVLYPEGYYYISDDDINAILGFIS